MTKSVGEMLCCDKCNQYKPDRCICSQVKDLTKLKIGGKYNWIGQQERLVYVGKIGYWHQFAKIEEPETVWCEVLESDMKMLEETKHI